MRGPTVVYIYFSSFVSLSAQSVILSPVPFSHLSVRPSFILTRTYIPQRYMQIHRYHMHADWSLPLHIRTAPSHTHSLHIIQCIYSEYYNISIYIYFIIIVCIYHYCFRSKHCTYNTCINVLFLATSLSLDLSHLY